MRIRKKQLLGLAGLAFVLAMTAIASAMPAPEAMAAETSAGSVGLTVQVTDDGVVPLVEFASLKNDDVVVRPNFTAQISYVHADSLKLYLQDTTAGTPEAEIPVVCAEGAVTYSDQPQLCTVTYQLGNVELTPEHQVENYVTRVQAIRSSGNLRAEDTVSFSYRAAHVVSRGEHDSNGNPIVYALLNEKVQLAKIQVFDSNNKPVFVNNGTEAPISFSYADVDPETGEYKITLDLAKYGLKSGTYTVVLTAWDTAEATEDSMIAISQTTVEYTAKTPVNPSNPGGEDPDNPGVTDPDNPGTNPEAPDTGINLFRDLNISRADYIITGVVVFGMVTIFALFLIRRRNKR